MVGPWGIPSAVTTDCLVDVALSSSLFVPTELVGIDDVLAKLLWTTRFLEAQDYRVNMVIVFRDSTSSMKLDENGHASASKRTRHFNIKYFYVTDLLQQKEFEIQYIIVPRRK